MTPRRMLASIFLTLTALFWVHSAEAQLEPRYYPPGSTTLAAYYVPHLNITVQADVGSLIIPGAIDYQGAVNKIAILNHPNPPLTSHLGIDTWRLPTASRTDPGCQSPATQIGLPSGGIGFYCTVNEIGYIYYTESHGQKYAPPTWPFIGTGTGRYWSSAYGYNIVARPGHSSQTRLLFDVSNGREISLHEFLFEGQVWPVTDGDPLALPGLMIIGPRIDFGSRDVGTTGSPDSVNVINTGLKPLTITEVKNSNPTEFPILASGDLCSGKTLVPGARCAVTFNFAPDRNGGRAATIEFISNAVTSPDSAHLVGTGLGVAIETLTPDHVDFGGWKVLRRHHLTQVIALRNAGGAAFHVLAVNSNNVQFVVDSDGCTGHTIFPTGLAERELCAITVLFHPYQTGPDVGHITIKTNSPSSPIVIPITGTGLRAEYEVTPASANFGIQHINTDSSHHTFTVTNTGNSVGENFERFYSTSDEFRVTGQHCSSPIFPGGSCTFDVVFRPKSVGPRSGNLRIPNTISSLIPLSGSGADDPLAKTYRVFPTDLHFGEQPVTSMSAAQSVLVANFGGTELTVTDARSTNGNFEIGTDPCTGQNVLPHTTCNFDVVFKPATAGAQSGLVWVDYLGGTPDKIAVTGTGTVPEVTAAPAQVSFSNQVVGTTSASRTFTVTNTGKASLTVSALTPSLAEFTIKSDACTGQTLVAGAHCDFLVAFTPGRDGGITGTINILSNAPSSPYSASVSGTGINALADVMSPAQLHFGVQHVGSTSSIQLVTMTNTGITDLPVTTVTSDTAEFTLVNDTCSGQSIPVAGTCVYGVQFSPTLAGARSGHIEVVSAAGTSPDHIALTGTGSEGQLSILPNHLSFGQQDVGTTSKQQAIIVTNSGKISVAIANVDSQNATEFPLISDTCSGVSIDPGNSCIIQAAFAPARDGGASGVITLNSDAVKSPHSMSVGGNGLGTKSDTLSPNELHFANLTIGSTSFVRTVTLSNSGTADVDVATVIPDNPDFTVVSDNCSGHTISPLDLCDFGIQFAPSQTGAHQGHIEVSSNAESAPDHVAVTGFGVESRLTATPNHLDFGSRPVGSSETRTFLLSNLGTSDITVSGMGIPSGSAFSLESDGCTGTTLTPGADCSFSVRFLPSRDGGASGVVEFISDAAISPGSITLTGSGAGTASELLTPTELHFGSQPLGTTTAPSIVTLTNSGTANLNVASLASDNSAYAIVSDGCSGQSIVPAGTCQFSVQFSAAVAGVQNGHITITSDGSSTPDHVALTGTAVEPSVLLSSSNIIFGTLPLGDSSVPQAITATNTGISPLSISSIDSSNAEFSLSTDTCSGQTLATGAQCSFSVSFKPTTKGGQSALLQFISSAATSPDTISAAGNGQGAPEETFTPASLVFPMVTIGYQGAEIQQVLFANIGASDLIVGSISAASPHYSVVENFCSGKTIAPQAHCTFGVRFFPLDPGFWDSQIVVQTNNPGSPHLLPVTGSGGTMLTSIIGAAKAIPTLGKWALIILTMLLGLMVFTKRRSLF